MKREILKLSKQVGHHCVRLKENFSDKTFLLSGGDKSAEDILRERFAAKKYNIDAFSSIRYIGVQTLLPPTKYTFLQIALNAELNNTTVRSRRQPDVVFKALDVRIEI